MFGIIKVSRLFRKYFLSLEGVILVLLGLVVVGYIIFLKSSTKKELYIRASIQAPQWWETPSQIPAQLLSSVSVGNTDSLNHLEVVELKYFVSQPVSWEVNSSDRYIGRIQFKVVADKQGEKLFYNQQGLLVGNPLVVEVGKTRLELLITDISEKKIEDVFVSKRILVRVYNKYSEQVSFIEPGIEFKDNDGFVYARVLNVTTELSRITTVDQNGRTHKEKDPWKYDYDVEIETLAKETNSRIIGYDGRTISMGKSYVFNLPIADDVGGYIMGIK